MTYLTSYGVARELLLPIVYGDNCLLLDGMTQIPCFQRECKDNLSGPNSSSELWETCLGSEI